MRLRTLSISIVLFGLAAFAAGAAASRGDEHVCAPAKAGAGSAAFERLKSLAGTWTGSGGHGDMAGPVTVNYKVSSGGTVVLETLFPDSPKEMLTIYYLDGNDLVLTHYCGLGNQPHMKAAAAQADGKLAFTFDGGGNIVEGQGQHMHDLTLEFVSPDELRTEWRLFADGKPAEGAKFSFKRS